MKLYNTLTKQKEEFTTVKPGIVHMYSCGPTVYNIAHIGNLRAYVCSDILKKTLRFNGYQIEDVMNITDVGHLVGDGDDGEDKVETTARKMGLHPLEIAQKYTNIFMQDLHRLNITPAKHIVPATHCIEGMINLIKTLEDKGCTYRTSDGIYFDASTFPDYFQLSKGSLEGNIGGARIALGEKRNINDFALWKFVSPNTIQKWDSPWGVGCPGWHIECSAISMQHLPVPFDIHTGGIDHIPIHHTNEIAQSEGAFSEDDRNAGPWVNYWLHNEFLVIQKNKGSDAGDGDVAKMSKSSGEFLTLQVLVDKGYHPLDYRYFLLGAHYRSQAKFSWDSMDSAKNSRRALVKRAAQVFANAGEKCASEGELSDVAKEYLKKFTDAIENDLATPQALACLQSCIKDGKLKAEEIVYLIERMDSVLGLNIKKSVEEFKAETGASSAVAGGGVGSSNADDPEAAEIDALVLERTEAKKAKDFAKADEIRNALAARGITIIDTPNGPTWKRS